MTTVKLYWSNICVLHRLEKEHLDKAAARLREAGIDLQVTHFGIGYPMRMAEYLAQDGAEIPDIIVSTDLEVFEDPRIFQKLTGHLRDLRADYPLKADMVGTDIDQWPELLPFLVIPLVFCSPSADPLGGRELSFTTVLGESGVAFGGVGNSGAKAVIKALWSHFGREAAIAFARRSSILPMPINAFQQARTGATQLAIAPSIYTRVANGVNLHRFYPGEGAIGLPSYIAAHKRVPDDALKQVLGTLLDRSFCDRFVLEGDLYCALADSAANPWVDEHGSRFLYPRREWFASVLPDVFEDIYASLTSE